MNAATATHISCALTSRFGLFPFHRYVCVPGVSWGLNIPGGEADLLVLSDSGWLTEIEIKISVGDLRRDMGKWKHRLDPEISHALRDLIVCDLYYAMPAAIWTKARKAPRAPVTLPPGAGLIEYHAPAYGGRASCSIVVQSVRDPRARKLTDAERFQLARLGTMRYWTRLAHKLDLPLPGEQEAAA